jgi:hypothetical protein
LEALTFRWYHSGRYVQRSVSGKVFKESNGVMDNDSGRGSDEENGEGDAERTPLVAS